MESDYSSNVLVVSSRGRGGGTEGGRGGGLRGAGGRGGFRGGAAGVVAGDNKFRGMSLFHFFLFYIRANSFVFDRWAVLFETTSFVLCK